MNKFIKRIAAIESRAAPDQADPLEIEIISAAEQVDHPERFDRVLISESKPKGGLHTKTYQFKRREHDNISNQEHYGGKEGAA